MQTTIRNEVVNHPYDPTRSFRVTLVGKTNNSETSIPTYAVTAYRFDRQTLEPLPGEVEYVEIRNYSRAVAYHLQLVAWFDAARHADTRKILREQLGPDFDPMLDPAFDSYLF